MNIPTRDEVGEVGVAFNRMAEQISFHTENLEQLVEERTQELEDANEKISELNHKLRDENVRLGAELAVAKHIQMMVLPKAANWKRYRLGDRRLYEAGRRGRRGLL